MGEDIIIFFKNGIVSGSEMFEEKLNEDSKQYISKIHYH